MAGLGLYKSLVRVVVQMPMACSRIAATHFRAVVTEARFCRWLLQTADRAESDNVALTHEFLAEMLGVRRTSVTEVASRMQAAGAINYTRGQITILKRAMLEKMSCECYQTLVDQSAILI